MSRIFGIDCGCQVTGIGIIDTDGRDHRYVFAGVLRTSSKDPMPVRLARLHQGIRALLQRYTPDAVAVEEVFHAATNVRTALLLAHVRGIALLAAAQAGLPVGEYSPLAIKSSVVGYGRAEKYQVQLMVASLLGMPAPPSSPDAADALAVAICHATSGPRPKGIKAGESINETLP